MPDSEWFAGTTRRPLAVWMPAPGPVAYHPQSAALTAGVISTGDDHVTPSSSDFIVQTVRVPALVPAMMAGSRSPPRFRVMSSQIAPVRASITGHGLPTVFGPSSQTMRIADHDSPPSLLRLTMRSISPASAAAARRPSAKARSVPFGVAMTDGMRYV